MAPHGRALVIINPLSGRGRRDREINADAALARRVMGEAGYDVDVRPTTRAGDASAFASDAVRDHYAVVVVWGGDGTVNEAASAVTHSEVPLAIVPAGSGNGLASDLRIPFEASAAFAIAAGGPTLTIDAGQIDDSYFFNIAGVGIDAVIAARFAERGMRRRGFAGYLQLSGAELLRYRCLPYTLSIDDESSEHRALLIAFANGRQYGNRLLIAPGARLDDGLLEVVIVSELSLLSIAARLPSLFAGRLVPGRGVSMRAARTVRVSAPGPIPYHVDGEPRMGHDALAVRVHAGALRVRAPRP